MYVYPYKVMCTDHVIRFVDPREGIIFCDNGLAHTRKCEFVVASMRRCWQTIMPDTGDPLAEGDVYLDKFCGDLYFCKSDFKGYALFRADGVLWPEDRPLEDLAYHGTTLQTGLSDYKSLVTFVIHSGKFRYKTTRGGKFFLTDIIGVDSAGWEYCGNVGSGYVRFSDVLPLASRGAYGERIFYGETLYGHYQLLGERLYEYIDTETGKSIPVYPKDFIRKELALN